MKPERVTAILTAAGRSSRMCTPKALLDWGGIPLIQHQAEILRRAGLGEIIVVLGDAAAAIEDTVTWPREVLRIKNPRVDLGRAESLRLGFDALRGQPDALLVVGVDQPLRLDTVIELIRAFSPERDAFAQPCFSGRRSHPVLFAVQLLPELKQINEETQGLRAVTHRHAAGRLDVSMDGEPTPEFNTPEEYQRALERLASEKRTSGRQSP